MPADLSHQVVRRTSSFFQDAGCFSLRRIVIVLTLLAATVTTPLAAEETIWLVHYMNGSRVGYSKETRSQVQENGKTLVKFEVEMLMKMKRLGQTIEQKIDIKSFEDLAGQLNRFDTKIIMSGNAIVTTGKVVDEKVDLETKVLGRAVKSSLPFPKGTGGFSARDVSFIKQPMKPGEERTIKMLMPVMNQITEVNLTAGKVETTKMLEGERKLLRIESVSKVVGIEIQETLWADSRGEIFKSVSPTMGMDAYRTTKEVALGEFDPGDFDMIKFSIVKIDAPANLREKKEVRYRATLKDGGAAKAFPAGPGQQVKVVSPEVVELTITAKTASNEGKPTKADREPNSLIQSDDARVMAMAQEVAPDEKDPKKLALAIEAYVKKVITQKDLSQGFASAAEVAKNRQGDCTEHGVLLAALARARGIPARVAVGLVYAPSIGGFGYHMWTEVWVDGAWLPLDGTLAEGGISSGHIKIAHSNLKGAGPFTAFLPVVMVMGKLKLEVIDE